MKDLHDLIRGCNVNSLIFLFFFINHLLQKHSSEDVFGKLINSLFGTETPCNSNLISIYVISMCQISKYNDIFCISLRTDTLNLQYQNLNLIFKY